MIGKSLMKQHYLKKELYSNLNVEEMTDVDYMYRKRVGKGFEIKYLGEYHDLHLRSDALLMADVFESFRKMCLKIYEKDPVRFLPTAGLAWEAALKKTKVKLELLTDIDNGIRRGICTAAHWYAKANYKYMEDYDKNKESSYLNYCDVNDLYGWAMPQKLPVNNFEWIEENSQFNEDFIKTYNEDSEFFFNIQKEIYINLIMTYHFYTKERNLKKPKSL